MSTITHNYHNTITHNYHNVYTVNFYKDILTVVTHHPHFVADWISEIENIHHRRLHRLIVGLDVEWRPSFSRHHRNPVATLQLCVGRRCLVFQILQYAEVYNTDRVPRELAEFLGNEDYTFVGVGIRADVEKLREDYGVRVGGRIVDLGRLAAAAYDMDELKNYGLKVLARFVLGAEMEKPMEITLGRWDNPWLTEDQMMYACIDAHMSFEIGMRLYAMIGGI